MENSQQEDIKVLQNSQDLTSRHLNKWDLRGTVISVQKGKSQTGITYLNVIAQVIGKKYTEAIPFVLYGLLAERLENTLKNGDTILAHGRHRSKNKQNGFIVSLVCEQLDIVK